MSSQKRNLSLYFANKADIEGMPSQAQPLGSAPDGADLGLTVRVTLSYIVQAGFSPGQRLSQDEMRRSMADLVQRRIRAADGVQPDDIDAVCILEVKDLNSDGGDLFVPAVPPAGGP